MPDASQIRKTSLPIEVERRLSVHNPVRDSHHTTSAFLSGSALPTEASPVPVGNPPAAPSAEGTLPFGAAGSLAPSGDVFSAFASLSKSLSPHQLQEFLHSLQTPGHGDLRSQVGPLCLPPPPPGRSSLLWTCPYRVGRMACCLSCACVSAVSACVIVSARSCCQLKDSSSYNNRVLI